MMKQRQEYANEEELQHIKLFHGADLTTIQKHIESCSFITLNKEDVLVKPGDVDEFMYIVLDGRLRVHLQSSDNQPISILETGDSVGEVSVIDQQPASGFVIADMTSRLLRLSEEDLWKIVELSHPVAYNLLRTIAYRLRFGNSVMHRIHSLLREFEYDAMIDPLTGFYNRRWLSKMLNRLMQRCKSGKQPLAVIMMDLDHFKIFNDTYGHPAGDRALNSIAKALVEHLRPEDTITRYGGEEFLAVLPGSDLEDARQVAERLRLAVAETALSAVNGRHLKPLTLSLGIAQMQPQHTPDQLIEAADRALYRAKHGGRDQVSN